MYISSVNIATSKQVGEQKTGIGKEPQSTTVTVTELGLVGDYIHHVNDHGGADQAVYVYGGDDYAWWKSQGYEFTPGTFGENCVVEELSCKDTNIGDRLEIGNVILEVTAPRIPCNILGMKVGDKKFPVAFRKSERPGFYCRVVREGELKTGMEVTYHFDRSDETLSLLDLFNLAYNPSPTKDLLERTLKFPIATRTRSMIEGQLQDLA